MVQQQKHKLYTAVV